MVEEKKKSETTYVTIWPPLVSLKTVWILYLSELYCWITITISSFINILYWNTLYYKSIILKTHFIANTLHYKHIILQTYYKMLLLSVVNRSVKYFYKFGLILTKSWTFISRISICLLWCWQLLNKLIQNEALLLNVVKNLFNLYFKTL